jgi:hypothetical protein
VLIGFADRPNSTEFSPLAGTPLTRYWLSAVVVMEMNTLD